MKNSSTYLDAVRSLVLIDDDADDQEIFNYQLKHLVPDIRVFSEPAQGLNYLSNADRAALPDLIVTDLRMPGIGGMEVLHSLRNSVRLAGIPVIVYSSHFDEQTSALLLDAGAIGCFEKTANLDDLKYFLLVFDSILKFKWLGRPRADKRTNRNFCDVKMKSVI